MLDTRATDPVSSMSLARAEGGSPSCCGIALRRDGGLRAGCGRYLRIAGSALVHATRDGLGHGALGRKRLTRRKYRTAMAHLERYGLARFQATHKGTIATLLDITIYDINEEQASQRSDQRPANKRPTEGHQAATNKNEKKEKKEKKGPPLCSSRSGSGVRSAAGGLPTFAEMDRRRAACALAEAQEEFLHDDEA